MVTGGSRGIGAEVAKMAGKEGAKVVVNFARNKKKAEEVAREVESCGGEAMVFGADIRDRTQVARMILATKDRFGGLDILINNAGVAFWKTFDQISVDEEEMTIDVNLRGVLIVTREALRLMLPQKDGVIVNIASGAGKVGHPGLSVYSAAKAGVIGFTQAAGQELDDSGVRMYVVCPGMVATDMTGNQGMRVEIMAKKILMAAKEEANLESGGELSVLGD